MKLESISTYIHPTLARPGLIARVESAFATVVNLVADDGARLALASPSVGNGPLNAVVDDPAVLVPLRPGVVVKGNGRTLTNQDRTWQLDLSTGTLWDPVPDYGRLAGRGPVVAEKLEQLREILWQQTPGESLARAVHRETGLLPPGSQGQLSPVQSWASGLTQGLERSRLAGRPDELQLYARQLAGLGPGLTPAGDDWLAGWLVGLRVQTAITPSADGQGPLAVEEIAQTVVSAAQGRTAGLSLAMLAAAAQGAVPQVWHDLLAKLAEALPHPPRGAGSETKDPIDLIAMRILNTGATSGADMLAGFLAGARAS